MPVAAGHKGGPRRGKTRTGGRRSCTFLVWFLLAATVLMVDVVQAVFTPADKAALKTAVNSCVGTYSNSGDGSACASSSYGAIGEWDVSKVTSMHSSTSTSVSTLFVHWTVSLICFFDLFLIHPCCCLLFCILSCPPPFRARCVLRFGWWVVFRLAGAFNADISKWETGLVTNMFGSTSTPVSTLFVH